MDDEKPATGTPDTEERRSSSGAQRTSKLNSKQLAFCREYMVDHNGARSAIRAGYSAATARQIGSQLLANINVSNEIARLEALALRRHDITQDRVLAELAKLGFANMQDFVRLTPDGDPVVDLSDVSRAKFAAITELTVEDFTDGRGENARDVRRIKVKMADKTKALENIAKHLGMLKDRTEISGPNGGPIQTEDVAKEKLIDKLLAALDKRDSVQAQRTAEGGVQ